MKERSLWLAGALFIAVMVISMLSSAPKVRAGSAGFRGDSDRYLLRVYGCDDGGRAYLNGTLIVDVGFAEDSNWLDITQDLRRRNEVRFQVMNKTGAITYRFQVRKNDQVVFDQNCGIAGTIGCEENRAFRIGLAREFVYKLEK
jgi:hypothetical protein